MEDEELIQTAYIEMYNGMIRKDRFILEKVLDENFILIHMTGMRQTRESFIRSILNGTLNYYSARHDKIKVEISGNTASMIGQSVVDAAVFGGVRSTWCLALQMDVHKVNESWKLMGARASTW